MELAGRTALVTGAGRGIGRAIALALARDGAAVLPAARSLEAARRVAEEIESAGGRAVPVTLDVADRASIARAARESQSALGTVDVLVNNAGVAQSAKTLDMDDEVWEEHLRVNLTGAYLVTKAFLRPMIERRWGRIVNVASTAGKVGFLYTAAYCASKHGLVGFTRALALEMARYGVTVNAVCPGFVSTEMSARAAATLAEKTGVDAEQALARLARFSPQNRLIEPEEVARMVVILASEGARGINGQAINIDGGAVVS